jgi:hypothetical protein
VCRNRASSTVALAALVACGLFASSCGRGGPSRNLVAGKAAARAEGVVNPAFLTDGHNPADGADWNAPGTAAFQGPQAFVEFDLGEPARIQSIYLQGDNNDEYIVSVSDDGQAFREIWTAPAVSSPGLRARSTEGLDVRGRWIRLAARGGDGAYSVAELQVWTGAPPAFAAEASSDVLAARVRTAFIYLVLAFAVLLFATRAGSPPRLVAALWLATAGAALFALRALADGWPLGGREVAAARAAAAAIALLAVARGWERARRAPPHRPTVVAACAAAAVLAFACFYNLGRPQFWHHGKQRPMFVHVTDMRIYQPFAKYFDELGYEGVYLASALAFAEDERGGSIEAIGATKIRDMHDFRMRTALEIKGEMLKVKQRFSPERWQEFKRDQVFFREAMGPSFLTSLDDHGANAPPSWVWLARLAIGHVPASEASLTAAGLLDAVLLLAMAWAIWASFGLLPMLVAMTVFGATDLYMFGTNWGGATLRHDWLVLLGFAACALRKQRWLLAGALLGAGTILRVVPAVGLMGVVAPAVAWLVAAWWRRRRPALRALLAENRAAVRVVAAAAVTMLAFFVVTGFLYSFGAWTDWFARIKALNDDMATNEVDLRMLVAGVDQTAAALMHSRRVLFVLAQLTSVAIVVLAARKRPLEDAMLLGLPLALTLMNSLNYHDHVLFLLVLLGARGSLLGAAVPLLVLCVAGYWADLDPDANRHFDLLTALSFAAVACVYFSVLRPPAPPSSASPAAGDGTMPSPS